MKFTRQHKICLVESSNLFIVTVVPDYTIHHKVYDCQNYKNTSNCLDVLRLEIYTAASSPFCCAGLVGLRAPTSVFILVNTFVISLAYLVS